MGFKKVTNEFFVPENKGDAVEGHIIKFMEVETVHGTADAAVIRDADGNDKKFVIGGGALPLKDQAPGSYVRVTYDGEQTNPNPKPGRAKKFKAFTVEVDPDKFQTV